MKIKFLGAAKNVTGSKFLLECNNKRILIDCGFFQERKFRYRNWEDLPVNPASIDTVLLTHAHIDHCGYLPKLVKDGFHGKILCTSPTAEIASISLLDAARLQESDAAYKKKRHKRENRKGPYPELPLFTTKDARKVLPLFKSVDYNKELKIAPGIKATFHDAGHILGSAMIKMKVTEKNKEKVLVFSGDIGRWDRPILCDPTLFQKADYVFIESTYGNRVSEEADQSEEKLCQAILKTLKAGGNIIIPTFAIERAQEIIYDINKLLLEGRIPPLFVFIDSPMAIKVTKVFRKHPSLFDRNAKALNQKDDSLFDFPLLQATSSGQESRTINSIKGTAIIMAGSGMCTGGRIKHHLANNISRPESTILFVGYQAEGTLGRQILERPRKVRILGKTHKVRANIEKINGFSAHADKNELLKWISAFKTPPKKIFVVHGEKTAATEFSNTLKQKFKSEIITPDYLDEFSTD